MIIFFDANHTRTNILRNFSSKGNYNHILEYNFNYINESILSNFKEKRLFLNSQLDEMVKESLNFSPDRVVYFNEAYSYIQILINKLHKTENVLVEEGINMYADSDKISFRRKMNYIISKIIFKDKNFKLCNVARGGFEDTIIAREPNLVNTECKRKIPITKEDFRKIVVTNKKNIGNIMINGNILICPTLTIFSKNKVEPLYDEIISYYYNNFDKHIFLKLHPAEKYLYEIEKVVNKYSDKVSVIKDKNITSEDLILSGDLSILVSDYSSTLVSAVYLLDNTDIVTYYPIMKEKYNIVLRGIQGMSFIAKLIKDNKIRSFKDYKLK